MKKVLFFILLISLSLIAKSQTYIINPVYGISFHRVKADSALNIPTIKDTTKVQSTDTSNLLGMYSGKLMYFFNHHWHLVGSGSGVSSFDSTKAVTSYQFANGLFSYMTLFTPDGKNSLQLNPANFTFFTHNQANTNGTSLQGDTTGLIHLRSGVSNRPHYDLYMNNAGIYIGSINSDSLIATRKYAQLHGSSGGSTQTAAQIRDSLASLSGANRLDVGAIKNAQSANVINLIDATSGNQIYTLPTAVGITGKVYIVKKIDSSSNSITIATTSSQTIDGYSTITFSNQYQCYSLVSNGTNWFVISIL